MEITRYQGMVTMEEAHQVDEEAEAHPRNP